MAEVGQEMVNPVTGERFVWRQTAQSTRGKFCECELHLDPGAVVAAVHLHPFQEETFEVMSGSIRLRIGPREEVLSRGDRRTIEAGATHAWGNAAPGATSVLVRLTPALRSEEFFETFCGLARDGKANSRGIPRNPLQLAVLAHEYRNEMRLAGPAGRPPIATVIGVLATLGRVAGFRARYAQYISDRTV